MQKSLPSLANAKCAVRGSGEPLDRSALQASDLDATSEANCRLSQCTAPCQTLVWTADVLRA